MLRALFTTRTLALLSFLALALFAIGPEARSGEWFPDVLKLDATDATAKVGERGTLVAKVRLQDGYGVLNSYNHRMFELSSFDEAVKFDRRVVKANVDGQDFVFTVGVTPTAAGRHQINGLIRVGYFKDDTITMVTLPLMVAVVGTE